MFLLFSLAWEEFDLLTGSTGARETPAVDLIG